MAVTIREMTEEKDFLPRQQCSHSTRKRFTPQGCSPLTRWGMIKISLYEVLFKRWSCQRQKRSWEFQSLLHQSNEQPPTLKAWSSGEDIRISEYSDEISRGASNTCHAANQAKVYQFKCLDCLIFHSNLTVLSTARIIFSGFIIPHKYGAPLVLRNTSLVCWYISTFHCSAATPACFVALLRQSQRRHS